MKLDCAHFQALAEEFAPAMSFAPHEQVFPIDADAWFQHCSIQSDWVAGESNCRGTALVWVSTDSFGLQDLNPVSGCSSRNGQAINEAAPLPAPPNNATDFFLDFGGWVNARTGDFSKGDSDYVKGYFSPYNGAINTSITQGNPEDQDTRVPFNKQGNPAVYAEAEWCGVYTRISQQNNLGDFGSGIAQAGAGAAPSLDARFDRLLAINYYFFYPLTDAPPSSGQAGASPPLVREGQWECISLYFRIDPRNIAAGPVDPTNYARPEFEQLPTVPIFAVYSQGVSFSGDGSAKQPFGAYPGLPSTWPNVARASVAGGRANPLVFVSSGTHRNFFTPQFTNELLPFDQGLGVVTGIFTGGAGAAVAGAVVPGIGIGAPSATVAAGALGAAGALTATGVGLIFLAILLILAIIFLLIAAADEHTAIPTPGGDFAPGGVPVLPGGTQANPTNPQTQAGTVNVPNPLGGLPGNAGAVTLPGALYNVVFCNRFDPTGECAPPTWWDFTGRWGVKVTADITSGWDNGSRRVDQFGRSRGYWNTLSLQLSGIMT